MREKYSSTRYRREKDEGSNKRKMIELIDETKQRQKMKTRRPAEGRKPRRIEAQRPSMGSASHPSAHLTDFFHVDGYRVFGIT